MRIRFLALFTLLAVGCESETAPIVVPTPDLPVIGTAFNPATSGSITGRVSWKGAIPNAPEFPNHVPQADGTFLYHTAKNPYTPQINPKSLGFAGVVVSLQSVEPATSKPWDLPPVAVEMGDKKIVVVQGDQRRRVGFVRRGDSISVSSTEAIHHMLRGRGDAFFSLTLPMPGKPVTRMLPNCGRVELSSGSGLYWVRGDLFVADHPYFAITDADGRFTLDRVPAGPTKLVIWHPGWESARMERDPDSTIITRMVYSPAIERVLNVDVVAGKATQTPLTLP
ncbi:MAG: carboxypeptidase-like regulatory domain-containing protein [Planctomycetes bacterium]|nr:carboxypeptidase-like regulatory domain-containing protein [Planctomycetota bacterium]